MEYIINNEVFYLAQDAPW